MINRNLSDRLKRQLFKPFRDEDLRFLLTVDHSTFAEPYRFVSGDPNELEELVSNGETYTTFPFEARLVSDDDQPPEATVRIQNADDRIGSTLLELPSEPVSITLRVVLRETPDVIEYEATNLELVDVEANAVEITGRLVIRGLSTEPCPGRVLSNRISPVFFR